MAPNWDHARIDQVDEPTGCRLAGEGPGEVPNRPEVSVAEPSFSFVGMAFLRPVPEQPPEPVADLGERGPGDDVAVVVGPAAHDRIQGADHVDLTRRPERVQALAERAQVVDQVPLARPDQQLAFDPPHVPAEEIESLIQTSDAGLGRRESEAPLGQKRLDRRFDHGFQPFRRVGRDDEVVGIADQVQLVTLFPIDRPGRTQDARPFLDGAVQSIQRHIRQARRENPALRCTGCCREELAVFPITDLEPFSENDLVHGNVVEHPGVVDMIETAFDVAFQHPLRGGEPRQDLEAVLDGVSRGPVRPKAVRASVAGGFGHRQQREPV